MLQTCTGWLVEGGGERDCYRAGWVEEGKKAGGCRPLSLVSRGRLLPSCLLLPEKARLTCPPQDLSGALKLVHQKCGNEFAAHLLQVVAPAAGLPQALAQQLAYTVQNSEAKDIRDALRSLLMQAQGIAVSSK